MSRADVSTPSPAAVEMNTRSMLPRCLLGGTEAMRKAGKTYLPQEPAESDDAYKNRLERTVLFNAFGKAVRSLTGKVFSSGIQISEGTPQDMIDMCEDIDLQGNDLQAFVYTVAEDAMAVGISHILVDFPTTAAAEGKVMSIADEKAIGARPYAVHIKQEQILGWKISRKKGKDFLEMIRIAEEVNEADGDWHEKCVKQVRVLTPGKWAIYRQPEGKTEWVMHDQGINTLAEIPLVTLYTRRTGQMTARPPLEDLAHVNVAHWQSSSDQRHIVHVARVPLLFGTGFDEEFGKIEIGPNKLITQPIGSTLAYVEHTGQSISAGADDLKQLEDKMAVLAMEPQLQNEPGSQTATARVLDTAEAQSTLTLIADGFEDAIDQVFKFFAMWKKQDPKLAGGVEIDCDFSLATLDAPSLQELGKARVAGDISREAYLYEFKRRKILSEEFNIEADGKLVAQEAKDAAGLNPVAPIPDNGVMP